MKLIPPVLGFSTSLILCGCLSAPSLFIDENEDVIVSSPLALALGSTDYAKTLEDYLDPTSTAIYDAETKTATTNWSWSVSARLKKPYRGLSAVALGFGGVDRHLEEIRLTENGFAWDYERYTMSLDACRAKIAAIAEDMKRAYGLKDAMTHETKGEELEKLISDLGPRSCATFMSQHGERLTDKGKLGFSALGIVNSKSLCTVTFALTLRPCAKKDSAGGGAADEARAKAHAEAARMRAMITRLFAIDFDTPETVEKAAKVSDWVKMETPFEGCDERLDMRFSKVMGYPIHALCVRHAYEGAVTEEELSAAVAALRARLEREYGAPLPPAIETGSEASAAVAGKGIPAYGDTRANLPSGKAMAYVGRVGDIVISIAASLPHYERTAAGYALIVRGAVGVTFAASPRVGTDEFLLKR